MADDTQSPAPAPAPIAPAPAPAARRSLQHYESELKNFLAEGERDAKAILEWVEGKL